MFTRAWEEASQSASATVVSPFDELQVWCKVVGINKGKVYGLGSESINAIGRQLYQDSTSSSVQVMKEEIEQLKNKLLEVETEMDELRERMVNNERQIEQNNKQIEQNNKMMEKMDFHPPDI